MEEDKTFEEDLTEAEFGICAVKRLWVLCRD